MSGFAGGTSRAIARLRRKLRRFLRDASGMSMIMVGFSLVPIAGAIALGYDTSQGYLVKSRLSAAVDAAALAGGRVFFSPTRDDDVRAYFRANFPAGYLGTTVEDPQIVEISNSELEVTAAVTLPTTFVRILGIDNIRVSATSRTKREALPLDVVLAIDVSGSMRREVESNSTASPETDSRIAAAREAAIILVDILHGTPPSTNVRVGVVPWGGKVNVTEFGTTHGFDGAGNPLPEPAGAGTTSDRYWEEMPAIAGTHNNPYDFDDYSFEYVEGDGNDAPDDAYVALDPIVRTDWHDDWDTNVNVRSRNVFGRDAAGNLVYQATYNRVYKAHNSGVPLISPPPQGWTGCVYARYAMTARGRYWDDDDDRYRGPSGVNSTTDENNAADVIDGLVANYGPGSMDWLGWMPMGREGDPVSGGRECELGMHQRSSECTTCPTAGIYRLANDRDGVERYQADNTDRVGLMGMLDSLRAVSNVYTNIPQGLAWAWRVLSPIEPFTEAFDPDGERRHRAIVLLTDGENTVRSGDAYNRAMSSRSRRDDRLRLVATNVKENGTPADPEDDIQLYTIQFANTDGALADLLREIATSPDYYHAAPTREELENVFREVATNLANLRISR